MPTLRWAPTSLDPSPLLPSRDPTRFHPLLLDLLLYRSETSIKVLLLVATSRRYPTSHLLLRFTPVLGPPPTPLPPSPTNAVDHPLPPSPLRLPLGRSPGLQPIELLLFAHRLPSTSFSTNTTRSSMSFLTRSRSREDCSHRTIHSLLVDLPHHPHLVHRLHHEPILFPQLDLFPFRTQPAQTSLASRQTPPPNSTAPKSTCLGSWQTTTS
jgi:hypothetical protein